jgi:hypothetical protein
MRKVFIKQNLLYDVDGTAIECPLPNACGCRTTCAWFRESKTFIEKMVSKSTYEQTEKQIYVCGKKIIGEKPVEERKEDG